MTEPDEVRWYRFDLNPEPWAIGPVGTGRRKGGSIYAYVGRNEQLYTYQRAIQDLFGEPDLMTGDLKLTFWFWRQLTPYKTEASRKARKNEADVTNLIKATEDALQGFLYVNDRDDRTVTGTLVSQTEHTQPCVLVKAEPWNVDKVIYDPEFATAVWRNA